MRSHRGGCIQMFRGDFNAKIAYIDQDMSSSFGQHFLKVNANQIGNMCNKTCDNRQRFLNCSLSRNLLVADTFFCKADAALATYKPPGIDTSSTPWDYQNRAQYDYILLEQRWKNTCVDTQTDTIVQTNSDHFPLWCTLNIKLKVLSPKQDREQLDLKPSDEAVQVFNDSMRANLPSGFEQHVNAISMWESSLKNAASSALRERSQKIKKPWITKETFTLIKEKHTLEHQNRKVEYKAKCKEVRKAVRKDWEKWLAEITDTELDIRDKWLGIKFLKRPKQTNLFERSNLQGQSVDFKNQADAAADYLEQKQWGNPASAVPEQIKYEKQCKKTNLYKTSEIEVEEVRTIIKLVKKGKSVGPDDIPVEFFIRWMTATWKNCAYF